MRWWSSLSGYRSWKTAPTHHTLLSRVGPLTCDKSLHRLQGRACGAPAQPGWAVVLGGHRAGAGIRMDQPQPARWQR